MSTAEQGPNVRVAGHIGGLLIVFVGQVGTSAVLEEDANQALVLLRSSDVERSLGEVGSRESVGRVEADLVVIVQHV